MGNNIFDRDSVFIIAEIGINHNGSLERAINLVDCAVQAGADCAKFQIRDLASLYIVGADANNNSLDLGAQYTLDLLNKFQLSREDYGVIFSYCREKKIMPLCTPWDESSVDFLESFEFEAFKVASADMTNDVLLNRLAHTGTDLIVSTGMAAEIEIDHMISLLNRENVRYALLHCNSTYPAPYHSINLKYLDELKKKSRYRLVGYSGHERGFEVPIAAVAMGAKIIEKHITTDRNLEGNDHRVSLLPDEFKMMVKAIRNVEDALGSKGARRPSVGERMNRESLAKSLVAAIPIKKGEVITMAHLSTRSPGAGLQPNKIKSLVGLEALRNMDPEDIFFESDLKSRNDRFHTYDFKRNYGVPVRFHDCESLASRANLDFVEFHLSYKDVDGFPQNFDIGIHDIEFTVHTPDLFAGDHLVDFASFDDAYRNRSVEEIQRVIDISRDGIAQSFRCDSPTKIIASLGGFSRDAFVSEGDRSLMYERVADSIKMLDLSDVELLPQTLPPFPWYLGGQLYCNLFVDHHILHFARAMGLKICFDVSHSKLACNFLKRPFSDFVRKLSPVIGHLHVVDAAGLDGEGLQVNEGEVDFFELFDILESVGNSAGFIPEIWQGHKDFGAAFWEALDRLSIILKQHE